MRIPLSRSTFPLLKRDGAAWRWGGAAVAVGGALLLRWLLPNLPAEATYLLFIAGIAVGAFLGGLGPGLLATGLSVIAAHVFTDHRLTPEGGRFAHYVWLFVFAGEGAVISWLAERLHASRRNVETEVRDLQQRQAGLCESEAELRLLLEGVRDYAIFMLDPQGRICSWTSPAEAMLGYSKGEVCGRHLNYLQCVPEGTDPKQGLLTAAMEGRWEGSTECVRCDGSRFWANVIVTALHDRNQDLCGFATVIRDVTERRLADDVHLRRAHELSEANRLKDEFLATVSHELRTPLNSILGWAQLLRGRKLDAEGSAHALETIEQSAKTQARLIEDLLDISRIITGKMRLDVRSLQLQDVIEAAVEIVRPAADAKGIDLQIMQDAHAGPILGDPNRLQQVVWNLLSNAIKFTPQNGRVQVAVERTNSHVEIAVKDTGVGINPGFLPYMFDAFRQADSSSTRSHKGLGLGLAIVRRLVELHGGTITAESAGEGKGATFRARLPFAAPPASVKKTPLDTWTPNMPETQEVASSTQLRGLRVVVVDDDPGTRDLLTSVLRQCAMEVTTVSTAAAALEAVRKLRPHVLLSDIEMPDEDGYSLIRRVRALAPEQGGRTPAVALTAYARVEDRNRALDAGFQLHMIKPFEPDELTAAIASVAAERSVGR